MLNKMFALMTYLALNIPGNPNEISCNGVQGSQVLKIKSCITYIKSGTLSIPSAKITLTCEIESHFYSKEPWTIYPKAGVAKDAHGRTSICKVTEYKDLIQANRQAN
jgi:hypothetical protein